MINFKYRKLNLKEEKNNSQTISIYSLIQKQIDQVNEYQQLDYSIFPSIGGDDDKIQFAPGAVDALFGGGLDKKNGWKKIKLVIQAINDKKISNWNVVERNIKDINVSSNIDKLIENLLEKDISDDVKKIFFEVAINSDNYESVKWGVGISGIFADQNTIEKIIVLARHPEFTLYASHILFRESKNHPEYKQYLVKLLPMSFQWGVVRLIDYIVLDKELINNKDVQRAILIYGMANNDGIPMEIGFTIAKAIDLKYFFENGQDDKMIRDALFSLMNTLLLEPSPLGGMNDLSNGQEIVHTFLDFIKQDIADIQTLGGLRDLKLFLNDDTLDWECKGKILENVEFEYNRLFSIDIIKNSLAEKNNIWLALNIIKQDKIVELKDEILKLFIADPINFSLVDTLGTIGSKADIQVMYEKIPEIVDLEYRKKQVFSPVNVHGLEHKNGFIYSKIVSYLGKNPTSQIIQQIKDALSDYDPSVRSAACNTILWIPKDSIDEEIKDLIMQRLNDSPNYVNLSAKKVAEYLSINND